ncbi:hypothetical protein [Embleya sp. NPDC005971]|uniref:hypothetical protein n=1 Tax=Embleya sp. NPDC005971 TaxID=3156724 RepID=UPI0033F6797A
MPKRSDITTAMVLGAIDASGRFGGHKAFTSLVEHYPYKVVLAAWLREDDRGHIDWGTSILGAWLTDEGRQALAALGGPGRQPARLQVLELPPAASSTFSATLGRVVSRAPSPRFAFLLDRCDPTDTDLVARVRSVGEQCGATTTLVTDRTIDLPDPMVDDYIRQVYGEAETAQAR